MQSVLYSDFRIFEVSGLISFSGTLCLYALISQRPYSSYKLVTKPSSIYHNLSCFVTHFHSSVPIVAAVISMEKGFFIPPKQFRAENIILFKFNYHVKREFL
jgi:hypothetical protein